jgi:hypothetical protein
MRALLTIILALLLVQFTFGQYNITSNPRCIAALKCKSINGDPLFTTAAHFFEYSRTGEQQQWLKLLSKDCFVKGKPNEVTKIWWDYLANNNIKFEILGLAPEFKTDQKYIYFKLWMHDEYKGEKRLALIVENGKWMVDSINIDAFVPNQKSRPY